MCTLAASAVSTSAATPVKGGAAAPAKEPPHYLEAIAGYYQHTVQKSEPLEARGRDATAADASLEILSNRQPSVRSVA
jgi:hypothetical protein